MKKIVPFSLLLFVILLLPLRVVAEDIVSIAQAQGYRVSAEVAPKASIVIDTNNGQILWEENSDGVYDPASMSKTMVIYLVFEAIAQGKIAMDTAVTATETDQAIGEIFALGNNHMIAGQVYTVEELLHATMVASSNAATLMLSHVIAEPGADDAAFLRRMNEKAQELGMTNTIFHNATGTEAVSFQGHYAPEGYDWMIPNQTSAKDLAILAYHLVKNFPDVLRFSSQQQVTIKQGTPYEAAFTNTLPGPEQAIAGTDGLITGSSPAVGYNVLMTVKRGENRLIAVVLGAGHWEDTTGEQVRHYFANALIEKAFGQYSRQIIAPAGRQEVGGQTVRTQVDMHGLVKEDQPLNLVIQNNRLHIEGTLDPHSGVDVFTEEAKVVVPESVSQSKIGGQLQSFWKYALYIFLAAIAIIDLLRRLLPNKSSRKRKRSYEEWRAEQEEHDHG